MPRLVDLAKRSWLSAFQGSAPPQLVAYWRNLEREESWYPRYYASMLVVEAEGRVVGLVQPQESEINGLWVDPDHQGRGFGAVLLRAGEAEIERSGHGVAWLTCSGFNERARRFYSRMGYVESSRTEFDHPSGLRVVELRMERTLGMKA